MININNIVYVDFLIEGSSMLDQLIKFNYLVIEETLGLNAPMFEISLTLMDDKALSKFKINQSCTIKFGKSPKTAQTYQFRMINYTLDTNPGEGGGFQVIFSGISDVMDFFFKKDIQVFHDKASYQALSGAISTVTPKIEYTSSDVQHWIRHNISEREFALRVLMNTWISSETFPIFGLSIEKKLIVKDAKKALNAVKATIKNTPSCSPTMICYTNVHVESNNAITSLMVGSGKLMPILGVKDWKRSFVSTDVNALNEKTYVEKVSSNNFKTHLDTYNTHGNYFAAEARNLTKWSQLEMNIMYVTTEIYIPEGVLTVGDAVTFIPESKGIKLKSLSGNWIVSGKTYRFGKRDVVTNLKLVRDFLS